MSGNEHPHYSAPVPPDGWLVPGDEQRDLPNPIPSVRLTGQVDFVESHFAEITVEKALRHFFADGDFPTASTDFDSAKETDYGHLFIRDAAYSLMMLKDTSWPARIGRQAMVLNFLKQAYGYQGTKDVPNQRDGWVANDGEKPGRIPHEIWDSWESNANAKYLHDELGWGWPVYFGAVDTTPMIAMMTAELLSARPWHGSEIIRRSNNDGSTSLDTLAGAWVKAVRHVVEESRITVENPEGLYETAAMSNLCWGDWDDSYDIIRDHRGEVAKGRVAHTQLQAFARSACLGLLEYLESRPDPDVLVRLGLTADLAAELRETADRLGRALTEHFLVKGDPEHGDYFVLGLDRDVETLQLRKLDVNTAKPALMLLVDPAHLPDGVAEVVVRQTLLPSNGLLFDNGVSNLSAADPYFDDSTYHHIVWPDKVGLVALGLEKHGYPALANELNERNWQNFDDAYVRGFHEFLRAKDGRPMPVQRDVHATVIGSEPEWKYRYVKHAMGGQLWALAAAARWQDLQPEVWAGNRPHRATDRTKARLERSILEAIAQDSGLRTEALYHRDDLAHFEAFTNETTVEINGREVPTSVFDGGRVALQGQRMPGEQSKGRSITDGFGL